MRAAVLHAVGDERLDLRDDVTVIGPGPGEVRVRVRAAGVCHTDLSAQLGLIPQSLPSVLGHEGAGEVVAVGQGVTDLGEGDHVILNWVPPCGTCSSCRRGQPYYCITHVINAFIQPRFLVGQTPAFALVGCGVFAEEVVVHRQGAVKIADDVPFEVAALIGCGVMTGVGAAINSAAVQPGDAVVVIGCGGGVGLSVIQGARIAGASVIVGVDTVASKLDIAHRFGATHVDTPETLVDVGRDATGGDGFDYAFDVVASPQTVRSAWGAARRGGAVVVVGAGSAELKVEFSPFELVFDGKRILPSMYGSANVHRDFPRLLGLWRAGRLDLEGLITHRLKLDDVNEALQALGSADVIRQVIEFP
jgi:S-(hydroxymethyl)glutathione dehydrogenase/alcohol dehydrogenase